VAFELPARECGTTYATATVRGNKPNPLATRIAAWPRKPPPRNPRSTYLWLATQRQRRQATRPEMSPGCQRKGLTRINPARARDGHLAMGPRSTARQSAVPSTLRSSTFHSFRPMVKQPRGLHGAGAQPEWLERNPRARAQCLVTRWSCPSARTCQPPRCPGRSSSTASRGSVADLDQETRVPRTQVSSWR
jgi:hypothetical protein